MNPSEDCNSLTADADLSSLQGLGQVSTWC